MNTITVQTEPTSLEKSGSQAITGVIFFDFTSYQFPEKGWNDFVIVVLCWWLSVLGKITIGKSDSEELRFMDGPLYVKVTKLNNNLCGVECFDGGSRENPEFSGKYKFTDILNSVLEVAKTTYSVCSQNEWDGKDISTLKRLIQK